nr:hypothetical protein [Veronia nyctiphanis]
MNISNGGYSPVYQQPVKHNCCQHQAKTAEKTPLTPEQNVSGVQQGNGVKATTEPMARKRMLVLLSRLLTVHWGWTIPKL